MLHGFAVQDGVVYESKIAIRKNKLNCRSRVVITHKLLFGDYSRVDLVR